jgi:hypothetical protein
MADSSKKDASRALLLFAALTAAYHLLNPFWYGDGPYYAMHIERGWSQLPLDFGHFLWHPVGLALWSLLKLVFRSVEAFTALRLLSSMATAAACFCTYSLALRLTANRSLALMAATLVGVSNLALSYGGSGCAYTTAMCLGVLALIPLVPPDDREWTSREGILASAAAGGACATWGPAVLLMPGLCVTAALMSRGSWIRRALRGALIGGLAALCLVMITGIPYVITTSAPGVADFVAAWRQSSHDKAFEISMLNVMRAIYGFYVTLVNLGSLATTFKSMLLDSPALLRSAGEIVAVPVALALGLVFAGSLFLILVRPTRGRTVGLIAIATVAPVAYFASGWKGTDVERFSLAIPMIAIVIAHGLAGAVQFPRVRLAGVVGWGILSLVALVNLGTLVIPALIKQDRGSMMAVGRIAREHMPENSALIIAGHAMTGDVTTAARYFYDVRVFNVTYDVVHHGSEGYADRIRQVADSALTEGGRVAVLSDLIGQPTPGGIGFIGRETPGLDLPRLRSAFSQWQRGRSWQVERYTFVEITPPSGSHAPVAR